MKTYLLKDKKAYIVATWEIDGAHGLPRDVVRLTNDLQQGIHKVGKQSISNGIKAKSAQRYAHWVIQHVNKEKGKSWYYDQHFRGMVSVKVYIQWCNSDDGHALREYAAEQIFWTAIMHMTTDLDFLVLRFKIICKIE